MSILKKDLRVSHDYVALDLIDDTGHIVSTPVYLPINKPVTVKWHEKNGRYIESTAKYNGEDIELVDVTGFEWVSLVKELLTEAYVEATDKKVTLEDALKQLEIVNEELGGLILHADDRKILKKGVFEDLEAKVNEARKLYRNV